MALFSVAKLDATTAAELAVTSHALAAYSQLDSILGLPVGSVLDVTDDIAGSGILHGNDVTTHLPTGWREVSIDELGLSAQYLDMEGYITLESPVLGRIPTGPQLKVLAEEDASGNIVRVSVSYTGTNSPVDVADYFSLNEGVDVAATMEPVLSRVAAFMQEHGLTGSDAIVTGYSLGGSLTNIQARFSEQLANGFFEESYYVGHAAAVIYEGDNVLNIGYENDVVHRFNGNHTDVATATDALEGFFENNDNEYSSSVDNVVLFDSVYARSPSLLASDSWFNPFSWSAHLNGMTTDAITRIVSSTFYELMGQDSVVVVSALGAADRETTWVRDFDTPTSSHYGKPAFILGSVFDDLLADGRGNDYLDGLKGDDTFSVSTGYNLVAGGEGVDSLLFDGRADDYRVYRLDDGSVAIVGEEGLTLAQDVERIVFDGALSFLGFGAGRAYSITESHLEDETRWEWRDQDLEYGDATQGTQQAEQLSGSTVFAGDGNDRLTGTAGDDLLVGEQGNDFLSGGVGNDRLYGGEGNDVIVLSAGDDRANGGHGEDRFVISSSSPMNAVIEDFSLEDGQRDVLDMREIFADDVAFEQALTQVGDNSVINFAGGSITLEGVDTTTLLSGLVLTGQMTLPESTVDI